MFGFGFALIPMYRAICQITGINNLVQRDVSEREVKNSQVDYSRTVSVEFDANARGPLGFKPEHNSLDVHPGELMTIVYDDERARPAGRCAGDSELRAEATVLQEDRVLLLYAADAGRERVAQDAGGVRDRSETAEGREDDHAVTFFELNTRPRRARQDRGRGAARGQGRAVRSAEKRLGRFSGAQGVWRPTRRSCPCTRRADPGRAAVVG